MELTLGQARKFAMERVKEMEVDRAKEKEVKTLFESEKKVTARELYLLIKKKHAHKIKKCNDRKMRIVFVEEYDKFFEDICNYIFMNGFNDKIGYYYNYEFLQLSGPS